MKNRKEDLLDINDLLAALSYLIGSLCNLFNAPAIYGNLLFVVGSILFTLPPTLRILEKFKRGKAEKGGPDES